jgi:hypothetical protein
MSDQQPLLNPSDKVSSEDDDTTKQSDKDTTVGIFQIVSVFKRNRF